jgi:hypothetical protein
LLETAIWGRKRVMINGLNRVLLVIKHLDKKSLKDLLDHLVN